MTENTLQLASAGAPPMGYRYGMPPAPYTPYGRPASPTMMMMMPPPMPQPYQQPQLIQRPQVQIHQVQQPQQRYLMNSPPPPQQQQQQQPQQQQQQQQQQQRRKLCFYLDEGETLPKGPFLVQIAGDDQPATYQPYSRQGALQVQGSCYAGHSNRSQVYG